jgi:hypothetical protein
MRVEDVFQNGKNRDSVEVLIREGQGFTVQVYGLRLEPLFRADSTPSATTSTPWSSR